MKSREVDAYIAGFPKLAQALLRKVRATIRMAAPKAEEIISYRIPAYRQHGIVVFFAGFKAHIGLFPPVRGSAALEKAVAKYAGPKGNLRFPYDEPLPLALISRIVRHQLKQDARRARERPARRKVPGRMNRKK
ncbi:MAG: hypothetical protein K0Q92_1762 [Steroidobacteraceae bacterium]|jgi:uncharacterized protein YdhG (YjbR/CyaY superfamily)|nr:hypothetical protein [Steroidobacteraceae bacterium]